MFWIVFNLGTSTQAIFSSYPGTKQYHRDGRRFPDALLCWALPGGSSVQDQVYYCVLAGQA